MPKCFRGILYNHVVFGTSFSDLKRKASVVANGRWKPLDEMTVTTPDGVTFTMFRSNMVCQNGTFVPGVWC